MYLFITYPRDPRVHVHHYNIDNNNSCRILYVYLYILIVKEYEGLSEELHFQMFPRFVNPEGRLEPSQLSVILSTV